jgi:pentatricopeptide repeat protein
VVSWTSAIARPAREGDLPATAAALSAMLSSPAAPAPNEVTLLTVLSACAAAPSSPLAGPLVLSLHALALKLFPGHLLLSTCLARFYLASRLPHLALQLFGSMPVRSVVTYNTMITGLMRNGLVAAAREVFDGMPAPDKVSWTALIDGCVKNGQHEEAIECFHAMLLNGVKPDYVTFIAVMSASPTRSSTCTHGVGRWSLHGRCLEG